VFDNLSEKTWRHTGSADPARVADRSDVDAAMREMRRALLEADVSLDVVRSLPKKSANRRSAPPWSSR